ncbi:ribosomal protection-like ABC-F family protein [Pontibacillus litoralis]|uniref:ABC transporter ATP-binding protein n=1 Tax=Pontibacillus litoralis JSM 072002 TaxID=1385512 RepID=A0A0A5GAH4_9BACI|nr:ABC-F family ATP-binding cassette domain-containing protein [Pontibacillus litoralis]KGX88110.1 ABC transporter ATP-binding protein [Pontibacillus litoralis JSM 072002]
MRYMLGKDIYYSIGERTLLDIKHLSIHQGDRIGLVGKNGQGKSLLLQYLLGQVEKGASISWYGSVQYFEQLDGETGHVSGGEYTLQRLGKLFEQEADVLLLDEPTNHLDWDRIEQLEQKLQQHKGAIILASHDRKMLDSVCTSIWELSHGKLTTYKGNYSDYEKAKALEIQHQYDAYESYVKEEKRLTERMLQKEQQAKGMKKAPSRMGNSEWQLHKGKASEKKQKVEGVTKAMQERINRLEKVDKPFEWDKMKMSYSSIKPIHRKHIAIAKQLTKVIDGRTLYTIDQLEWKTGSKTALIGNNASGKTTLLNQLMTDTQQVDITKQAVIGYFDQTLATLPEEKTILHYVQNKSSLPQHIIRTLLGRLRFPEDDVHKRIGVLSGGERVKVALATLLAREYNVLILDEPTNHLDVEAITALEQLINEYPGTVLLVTHDRRFIEHTADHLWMLKNGTLTTFEGTLHQYDQSKRQRNTPTETTETQMALETKLTELISRLSIADPKDNLQQIEQQYQETLNKLNALRNP